MSEITVTRRVKIPDAVRIQRCKRAPELGPKILFFSGGTAIRGLSDALKHYTHNSIHLLTPFDSGGSSAELRRSFNMPAVGDIRSRLMALADESFTGNPEVYRLARYRLSDATDQSLLIDELDTMIEGEHKLVSAVPNPLRRLIRLQLGFFKENMPPDFNLKGASIGNLILTGGYLNYHRHLDPILYLFSKLLMVQGIVRSITSMPLHLVASLQNGEKIIGQHLFTGKESEPIGSPIVTLSFSTSNQEDLPVCVNIKPKIRYQIADADMICYPPGSFYSSLNANILLGGVGETIANKTCPKIYVPNLGNDPEQYGMDLISSVETLLMYLRKDAGENVPTSQLLNYILLDSSEGDYGDSVDISRLQQMGVVVIDTPLITEDSSPFYDDRLLVEALLSLS